MRPRVLSLVLLPLLLLVLPSPSPASSPPLGLKAVGDPAEIPQFEVLDASPSILELEFRLDVIDVQEVEENGIRFQSIAIPGGGLRGAKGAPAIPTFSRFVAAPDGARVRIESTVLEEERITGVRLMPVQGWDDEPFAYDIAAYAKAEPMRPAASVGPDVRMRDLNLRSLDIEPVRFDPESGTLTVARAIRIRVAFEGGSPSVTPAGPITPSFDSLYGSLVVNYEQVLGDRAVAPGTYLIICPNDTQVTTRLQPLVDWRTRKGTTVRLATTAETGTTANSIKAYIQNAYNTWKPALEYVCLVGDATGSISLPTWREGLSGYNGEGDHPYTLVAGGDMLSDVHLGRLSVTSTTELETVVNKVVSYESTPYMDDTSWYTRACLVGDPNQSGLSVIQVQQWIKERIRKMGFSPIDTVFGDPFVTQMTTALNRGDTIFSYRGWYGMSGWTNSNTYALSNGRKMPFTVTITCGTGSFADETACRSEGFLRAGSPSAPKGGIAGIGTATTGTHTRFNNCIHMGIFQGLLWEGDTELGPALTRGKLEFFLNYGANDPSHVEIWSYWNNLMGDPATDCWLAVPAAITVEHPASVPVGTNAVRMTVRKAGSPLPEARVCLKKGTETFAVGFTDASGEIELPVSTPTAGSMLVTVTKHNIAPYLGTITVAAAPKFVGYAASAIDDDASGESSGNGNGFANPGETIELRVQLKNFGTQTATGVSATLTTEDPYVTITDASETYGDIAGGGMLWCPDDFGFTVGQGCPDGHTLRFGLEITSGSDNWHSLIDVPVTAAALAAEASTLYNAGGNGILDPGETVGMSVRLRNTGHADATSVTGTLTSQSAYVTVTDAAGAFGNIAVGATGENTGDRFSVSAAPDTYQGYLAAFRLVTEFSGGTRDTTTTTLTVGTRSSDDPVGPDRYGYLAYDNTDTSYPDAPTYQWIEIDPSYGGSGTQLNLPDNGTYQDRSITINLPFTFQYYGTDYTTATVCSNGWIVPGHTYLADYRNWTLPGAGGPNGIICGFWDDLNLGGGGKVLTWNDAANHRFVIEWSRVRNEPGSTQTFEIILHDPAFHTTETGDGPIVMQYATVNNNDSGDNYATVGIESPDGTDALLYTYYADYSAGAATLATGRAIRYVPAVEQPQGSLTGLVTVQGNGAPIEGAEVTLLQSGRTFTTGPDGRYGGPVAEGLYTVTASRVGFEPDTALAVFVRQGFATVQNFSLVDNQGPVITTTAHPSTSDTIGPYVIPVTINDPSGVVSGTLYYKLFGNTFTAVPLTAQGGDAYIGEIPGQDYISRVEYYVEGLDGGGRTSVDPPGAPGVLYSFFVTPVTSLFTDTMELSSGWTVGAGDDNASTGIWERVDPNATYNGGTMVQPEDDHTAAPGVNAFITGQSAAGAGQGDNDVDGGKTTLLSPVLDLRSYGSVTLRYYRWYTNDTGNAPGQDTWEVGISSDGGASWTPVETTTESDRSWRLVEVPISTMIAMTSQVQIRFVASDLNDGSVIEAGVDDVEVLLTGVVDAPAPAEPAAFTLAAARPNPFGTAGTRIEFGLERAGEASLAVYDIQGRLVAHLVDGSLAAGRHVAVWNGRDAHGQPLPGGVYFCRLESGGRQGTIRLIALD